MGQGTESCGGYEVEYDPYYEELRNSNNPCWTRKNGTTIPVSKMTKNHLRGAIRVAERASMRQSFSCDSETFDEWVELLTEELASRDNIDKKVQPPKKTINKRCI